MLGVVYCHSLHRSQKLFVQVLQHPWYAEGHDCVLALTDQRRVVDLSRNIVVVKKEVPPAGGAGLLLTHSTTWLLVCLMSSIKMSSIVADSDTP